MKKQTRYLNLNASRFNYLGTYGIRNQGRHSKMISKTEKYIIEDVLCWMDGGTVTLKMRDQEGETFDIEFAQKVFMKRYEGHPKPGSLSLNRKEVEVRSEEETHVLAVVESAVWGEKILAREKGSYSKIIGDCIDFVRSDRYLTMSKINPTT